MVGAGLKLCGMHRPKASVIDWSREVRKSCTEMVMVHLLLKASFGVSRSTKWTASSINY